MVLSSEKVSRNIQNFAKIKKVILWWFCFVQILYSPSFAPLTFPAMGFLPGDKEQNEKGPID